MSVAESPAAPPVERRAARLEQKVRAGARACIVNHAGGAGPVARFVEDGPAIPYLACVPVITSHADAERIAAFPGLHLPPGFLARVLGADDPAREGVAAAAELAEALLAIPGVRGVDLGAPPAPGREDGVARALATVARALR